MGWLSQDCFSSTYKQLLQHNFLQTEEVIEGLGCWWTCAPGGQEGSRNLKGGDSVVLFCTENCPIQGWTSRWFSEALRTLNVNNGMITLRPWKWQKSAMTDHLLRVYTKVCSLASKTKGALSSSVGWSRDYRAGKGPREKDFPGKIVAYGKLVLRQDFYLASVPRACHMAWLMCFSFSLVMNKSWLVE